MDGFRFDLASALARELHEVDRLGAFFDIIRQDPVLSQVKLIAEPWDLGEGGYQVGNFPSGWAEWNDKYRDTMRAYWKGDGGLIGEFARRLTGSSRPVRPQRAAAVRQHQLRHRARRLHAARLVSATTTSTTKPTARTTATATTTTCPGTAASKDRPTIRRSTRCARARSATCCATLLLSQGVPMLLGGRRDRPHAARQQQRLLPGQRDLVARLERSTTRAQQLLEFARRMIALRREPSGVSPPPLLPGPLDARQRRQGHRLADAGRHAR